MAVHLAVRLSLLAFATVALHGALAGSDFEPAMQTALAAGAVFYGLGLLLGDLARRVIEEQVDAEFARWKQENLDDRPEPAATNAPEQRSAQRTTPSRPARTAD